MLGSDGNVDGGGVSLEDWDLARLEAAAVRHQYALPHADQAEAVSSGAVR